MTIMLDNMVVQILRDAEAGERGFDKNCRCRQVHILLADNSTTVVPVTALTEDGIRMRAEPVVAERPVVAAAAAPVLVVVEKEDEEAEEV